MRRRDVDGLDSRHAWWAPAVVSPERDWAGDPGCRRGARYLVDIETMRVSRDVFTPFDNRVECLSWILSHRLELNRNLPGAPVRAVRLDRWLLGME